jgi:uncharacterized protein (DUF2132 family)
MMQQPSKDPLHGKRLDAILEELVEYYNGFEELGNKLISVVSTKIRALILRLNF